MLITSPSHSFWYSVGSTGCASTNIVTSCISIVPCACRLTLTGFRPHLALHIYIRSTELRLKLPSSNQICSQEASNNGQTVRTYLGNVPVSGCVVEVLVDVVVHATGHVLEEFRHASGPATSRTPLPRSIVEHLAVAHEADQRTDRTHFPGVQDAISPCASVHNDRTSQRRHVPSCMY